MWPTWRDKDAEKRIEWTYDPDEAGGVGSDWQARLRPQM